MKRVYVIDDETIVQSSMELLLRLSGYEVRVFETGDAFMTAFNPGEPGCVLLDLRLPGSDGLNVLSRLRGCGSPVVLLSGHMDPALGIEALRAGAFDVIAKPYDPDHLLQVVQSALEQLAKGERFQIGRA